MHHFVCVGRAAEIDIQTFFNYRCVVILHCNYLCIHTDLMEMASKIESKPLKEVFLQAELCKVIDSIRVREVTNNYTKEFLQLYFENPKKSGGGKVSSIQLLGNGEAIVTFQDPRGMLF